MATIARKFLVASLIYLVLGLLAQAVTVFDTWLGFNPLAYTALISTEQTLLVGWLTQLGMALMYDRRSSYGSMRGLVVLTLLNIGLPLTIIGQPGLIMLGGRWLGPVAAVGALLQLFAGVVFVYDMAKSFKENA